MKKLLTLTCAIGTLSFGAHAFHSHDKPEGDYPVVVIGSGYGGSIAAYNLTRKGVPTLVIERGQWWTVEDPTINQPFPTRYDALPNDLDPATPDGDARVGWLRHVCGGNLYVTLLPSNACDPTPGLLERVGSSKAPESGSSTSDFSPDLTSHGLTPLTASGVGGGSLVNNGVTFMPTKGAWDLAYPADELPHMQAVWYKLKYQGYFFRTMHRLGATKPPADILASEPYEGTSIVYDFFAALGYPELDPSVPNAEESTNRTFAPVLIDWDAVREEMSGERVASVINGEAWWGINSGAKLSLDTEGSYLGKALKTGLAEVKALHTVSDISYDEESELYTITVVHTDEGYNPIETFDITTPNLIMSAGSLGTSKLLVRARDNGSLPALNEHVGTRFSSNGNVGGFGIMRSPEDVAIRGPLPQGGPAGVKIYDTSEPGNPIVLENLPAPQPGAFEYDPELSSFLGAVSFVGLGIPTKTGYFEYIPETDSVELHWPEDGALNVRERYEEIFSNFGPSFVSIGDSSQGFTLHPLGGIPYGLATDMNCELEGYDGLYAVDGSIIPGSAAATNPSGLISAMSEMCMHKIATKISFQYHRR